VEEVQVKTEGVQIRTVVKRERDKETGGEDDDDGDIEILGEARAAKRTFLGTFDLTD
jgi:hypothetical protein